jgi:hypothetical protein
MQVGRAVVVKKAGSYYNYIGIVMHTRYRPWPSANSPSYESYTGVVSGMFSNPKKLMMMVKFSDRLGEKEFDSYELRPATEHEEFLYHIYGSAVLIEDENKHV